MRELFLLTAVALLLYVLSLYIYARVIKDISIIDIAWGFGFAMIAVILLMHHTNRSNLSYLVCGLVIVWGIRLGTHIGLRKINKPEDWRYARWRKDWGKSFEVRSLVQVFLLQAVLIGLIAAPLFVVINDDGASGVGRLQVAGAIIWLFGFL